MKKENVSLLIGLSIPIALILILAGIIFLPRLYVEPQYDFVYAIGDYPTYINTRENTRTEYRVVNGKFSTVISPYEQDRPPFDTTNQPEFYHYDVSEQKNIPLSLEDLQSLTLNPSLTSPDGFTVTYARSQDNVFEAFFGGRNYSQLVLAKGSVSIPLQIVSTSSSQRFVGDNNIIGWITNN